MPDTYKLRKAVEEFAFRSRPTSLNSSSPCTVEDVNKIIKELAKLMNTFIEELEEE